jgi:hypothetical protein
MQKIYIKNILIAFFIFLQTLNLFILFGFQINFYFILLLKERESKNNKKKS